MTTPNTVELVVVSVPIRNLIAYSRNARTHSKHQIRQIADSIRTFGFLDPVIIDGNNQIMAGHGRVAAATLLGIESVPTIQIEHLSPDQIRAYILVANKVSENAGWDKEILAIELQHLILSSEIPDVTLTGLAVPEIDLIIQSVSDQPGEEDEPEIVLPLVPITQLGDLWQLGRHRILCANSLEGGAYQVLFGGERASAAFSDPPFNVRINGHVSGNGQVRHSEFSMAW